MQTLIIFFERKKYFYKYHEYSYF